MPATQTKYPIGNITSNWTRSAYTYLSGTVNDSNSLYADGGDDNKKLEIDWDTTSLTDVTNIDVIFKALNEEAGSYAVTIGVSLIVNGVETAQQFFTPVGENDAGDPFEDFTISFDQATYEGGGDWSSITSLVVAFETEASMSSREEIYIGEGSVDYTGTEGPSVPGAPVTLTATAESYNTIRLDWEPPVADGGATVEGYTIERKEGAGAWSTLVADTGNVTTVFVDTGLSASTLYTYRVSAKNSVGTGAASNEASDTTEAAPVVSPGSYTSRTSIPRTNGSSGSLNITQRTSIPRI